MLTDTHAHLASNQFRNDLEDIIQRAEDAGVSKIICIGTNLEDCLRAVEIANTYDSVYAAVGIHPCEADTVGTSDAYLDQLRSLAKDPKVVAIGEIGLDFYHPAPEGYTEATWETQQNRVLQEQLHLANELQLNTVLHSRNSFDKLKTQVEPWNGKVRGVFHCFTGSAEEAKSLYAGGHLVSFTGIVTFKNAADLQACLSGLELNEFMLETDCPYLAPIPYRGKRNEPSYVRHTAEFVANLKKVSLEQLASITSCTADQFFVKQLNQ